MRLRSFAFAIALLSGGVLSSLAQQPTGPATPEDSESSVDRGDPVRTTRQPYTRLARPEDGVQHADLDKAWEEYEAAIAKGAERIQAAISKQFDAATARGDLDDSEKWQAALEIFVKSGEVPDEGMPKTLVNAAITDCKKAKEELRKGYEGVVKTLTIEKKIEEAKAVRTEARCLNKPPDEDVVTSKSSFAPKQGGGGGVGRRKPSDGPNSTITKSIQPVREPKNLSEEIRVRLPTAEELAVLGNAVNLPTSQVRAAKSAYLERIYPVYGIERWSAVDVAYLMALSEALSRISGDPSIQLPRGFCSGGVNGVSSSFFLASDWALKSKDPKTFIERVKAMDSNTRKIFDDYVSEDQVRQWLLAVEPPAQTAAAKAKALDSIMQSGILSQGVVEFRRSIQTAVNSAR